MYKTSLSILLLILQVSLQAQALEPLPAQLNFPNTDELQASSQSLSLYNPNSYPIEVEAVDRFYYYNRRVFSVSDSVFTVMPGDTFNLTVSFAPVHNMLHQQALVFKTKSGFGHTAVGLQGQGVYSKAYYNVTRNQAQESLKTALSTRIGLAYNSLGYTTARDNMYATIDNNGGQVECAYTGRTASFSTRAGANSNNFNCEHTFPQGFFSQNEPMRSDIHHLFPTDVTANSRRSNDPFGVVSNPTWTQGGSKSGGGKFEPRDAQKGATARAMMYFVLRYQDYNNHFAPQENILRQWHEQFPPNTAERNRNDAIYSLQNNRNPFVDYPQFTERISDFIGTAQALDNFGIYYSDDTIHLATGNSGKRRFQFVLYGQGNMGGAASNFILSSADLSFYGGNPGNLNLPAGSYASFEIEFETGQIYNDSLSFEAFGSTIIVPIVSGPVLSEAEELNEEALYFYPNPNNGILRVNDPKSIHTLQLVNLAGRSKQLEPQAEIDLRSFSSGLYILRFQMQEGGHWYQRKLLLK